MSLRKKSALPSVLLKASAVRRIAGCYPFGHSGDIERMPDSVPAGEVVNVCEPNGRFIGRAYFNAGGATPLRMLSWDDQEIDLKFYRLMVRKALAKRKSITGTNAMRLLHAEADGMPGVVADLFGEVLSIQIRNAGAERHRELILKVLKEETGAKAAFERSDTSERLKEGLGLVSGVLWGDVPERIDFYEDDLNLHFSPLASQKTGFFLDQRDNRRMMRALVSSGGGFLDVYSYTGGFSLHAAKAGAKSLAIDKDNIALGVLEKAARENGLQAGVRWGDALEQLGNLEKEKRTFSAAVIDPPTLAKRKDDIPRAKRIFTDSTSKVLKMLSPGGYLLISTCAHYIRVDDLLDSTRVAASEANTNAEVVSVTYQPADHPHILSVPESLYLKSILLRKE